MNNDPDSVSTEEEHPDVAEISAFTEGILSPERSGDVRAHIDGCVLCADVLDSLDEIRGLLGELPGPPQMPDDIAARIDAALAAEALLDATAPSSEDDADDHELDELTVEEEAAVRALLSGADEPLTDSLTDDPEPEGGEEPLQDTRETTGPGTAPTSPRRTAESERRPGPGTGPGATGPSRGAWSGPGRLQQRPRRRWPRAVLVTACAAAVIGLGGFFLSTVDTGDQNNSGAAADKAQSSDGVGAAGQPTPHVYTKSNVTSLVQGLLTAAPTPMAPEKQGDADAGARSASPRSPLIAPSSPDDRNVAPQSGPVLPACVLEATRRSTEQLVATDLGQYEGRAVGVVVLPDHSDAKSVNVFLVDSSCEASPEPGPGKVLLKRTVPRS